MGEAARRQSFPPDRSRPAEHAVVPAGLIGGVMDNRRPSGVVRWPVMTLGARGIPARGPAPPRTPALPLGLLADPEAPYGARGSVPPNRNAVSVQ